MEKQERWLAALGDLVRKDRRYFGLILKDQMPGKTAGVYEKCEAYVERLSRRQEEMIHESDSETPARRTKIELS